jgi:hypothetical protein
MGLVLFRGLKSFGSQLPFVLIRGIRVKLFVFSVFFVAKAVLNFLLAGDARR